MDSPSAGEVNINGQAFSRLSDNERGNIRNRYLGFVYQFHHLLPEFTAAENVAMPMRIGAQAHKLIDERVAYLLNAVGLSARSRHKPAQLSGGERQRVAIARALAMQPSCVLLDEPTGNLDRANAENIHALIDQLRREQQTSFVIVTHDEHLAKAADSMYALDDGELSLVI